LIVLALLWVGTAAEPAAGGRYQGALLPHEFTQVHMGMPVRMRFYAATDEVAQATATAAFARIAALDQNLSDYRPDSELRKLGETPATWSVVSPELFDVLARSIEVADASNGAFDPTVGPLVALWRASRDTGRLPDSASIVAAKARTGWRLVKLDRRRRAVRLMRPGMRLDLGGIAKGYILQQSLHVLRLAGITRALIEAGGDIVVGDAPPDRDGWRIDAGRADPAFAARAARLTNAALATSGPSAQFVEMSGVRYSHIIDPRTGVGVTNRLTAWVIAADAATADALATALTVVDERERSRLLRRIEHVAVALQKL
jgi:FAD:protein FMN transferase